jgi:hypothetical protein
MTLKPGPVYRNGVTPARRAASATGFFGDVSNSSDRVRYLTDGSSGSSNQSLTESAITFLLLRLHYSDLELKHENTTKSSVAPSWSSTA